MSAAYTGLVIAAGALVACICFPFLPRFVSRYGAQQMALIFALLEILALLALSAVPGVFAAAFFVAVTVALQPFLAYELDLLLEATVLEEGTTGRVRALFLTAWNVASLGAPLLLGALLASSDAYNLVFLAAAAALVPFVTLFAARKLPQVRTPQLSHMRDTLHCLLRDRDLAAVTFGHLLLYLFFVWAPLYVPIYLHNELLIPWSDLSWIFFIMLLPYTLIQYPSGVLADRYVGDKEMMFAGFLLAGASLAAVGLFSSSTPFFLIMIVLITSRIGSALIESMTEGHFFRRVSERDINSVSIFRGIWPLADLIAPIIGSIILLFGNYQLLFFITGGIIAVFGVIATCFIRDFR